MFSSFKLNMTVTIKYYDLRGIGESIRLMLEHLGVEYKMEYIASRDAWDLEKPTLGIDYVNLPIFKDDDVTMSQSYAIFRYIARKYGKGALKPETEEEMLRADVADGELLDLRLRWGMLCYSPEFEKLKQGFLDDMPKKLRGLEEVLAKREWIIGKLSYVDFEWYEILDHMVTLYPGCYEKLPNVKKYTEAFEALPNVKAYRASGRFKRMPIFGPWASWGGKA